MLALILGWVLARRAWGARTADLFLALAAWVPLDLQQSHYATVEAHHTAWIMLALAASYWLAVTGRATAAAAAGAAVGAALAVKVASLALGLPLGLALLVAAGWSLYRWWPFGWQVVLLVGLFAGYVLVLAWAARSGYVRFRPGPEPHMPTQPAPQPKSSSFGPGSLRGRDSIRRRVPSSRRRRTSTARSRTASASCGISVPRH